MEEMTYLCLRNCNGFAVDILTVQLVHRSQAIRLHKEAHKGIAAVIGGAMLARDVDVTNFAKR